VLKWILVNSFVAYMGYILAAYTITKQCVAHRQQRCQVLQRGCVPLFPQISRSHWKRCLQVLEWTLLNSFIAYIGYILAAYTIDKAWMGRMRLQSLGFLMSFVLFICCGLAYDRLILPSKAHVCTLSSETICGLAMPLSRIAEVFIGTVRLCHISKVR